MKKTLQTVCAALAVLAVLALTGCKDTAALKSAVEEANKNLPQLLASVGQATGLTVDDNALTCELTANGLSAADQAVIGKYAALELQRTLPDLMKMAVENGLALKCNVKSENGESTPVEVSADELKTLGDQFAAAGGQVAPVVHPLYNAALKSSLPLEIGEGLTLKDVKLKEGKQTFFINVDDEKAKFDDVRGKIVKSLENASEKVSLAGINLSMVLPLLQELNYEAIFRYSAKGGKETFMEITAQEIKDFLAKGDAPAEEAK